ncbi:MAG: hypothetical protein R3C11_19490 [Planctomycetaceae bacterium]
MQDQIPLKATKPEITYTVDAAIVLWQDEKLAIRQYASDERWAGLWDFPRFSIDNSLDKHKVERPGGHLEKLEHAP